MTTVRTPAIDEAEFEELLAAMVADEAPRLFAVIQEYGEQIDARISAWGMAFENGAEVVAVDQGLRMNLRAPENALRLFNVGDDIRARLVWVNPCSATPADDD
jgi:hypothetical protein